MFYIKIEGNMSLEKAKEAHKLRDYHLAYNICYELAKEGDGAAMYHMANYHESGLGREAAIEQYRRSC